MLIINDIILLTVRTEVLFINCSIIVIFYNNNNNNNNDDYYYYYSLWIVLV